MYKLLIKPLFFLFPPETIHHLVFNLLKFLNTIPGVSWLIRSYYSVNNEGLKRTVFGLTFANPIGLAAGFDKDARLFNELANYGFGFVEIGTLTPLPQPGNDKPRMFRLPADEALINRMGFNNEGVAAAVNRLKKRRKNVIIGGNIGKNKITENEAALGDYVACFKALYNYVDYFVINVSSPNTPGLRALQEKEPLLNLLSQLKMLNVELKNPKPILLKIAPDLTNEQLNDIIDIVNVTKIDGVIATNTTINRSELATPKVIVDQIGAGGLSGKPLANRAIEVVRHLHNSGKNNFVIIGVGGIHSAKDALAMLAAGATLIQVYTGFIYEGPGLIKRINKAIINTNKLS